MNKVFNPSRLKAARLRRGCTIKALSELAGRTSRTLSSYENGREEPPFETLEALSSSLGFPVEFFYAEDLEEIGSDAVSFRALSKMKASQRNSAISAAELAVELNQWLEEHLNLPQNDLPDYRDLLPESAANALRQEWGLGELSIKNMLQLLESKGIRVFSLYYNVHEIDAFSFWKGNTPYIFSNHQKSAERSRFDAAHELGHLLLHKHAKPQGREAESQADSFASAFLMPKGSVIAKSMSMPDLASIIRLKKNWNVSAAALVRRLKDLDLITDWYYQKLNILLSQRGFLRKEPEPIEHETSLLFEKAFSLLWKKGFSRERIARELCISMQDLDDLVFGISKNLAEKKDFSKKSKLCVVK